MIYTLTLNPAIDHVVRLNDLDEGETNRAVEESISAGGKGINVSKILKNLGERSIALGFVAGFTGKEIERILRDESNILSDFIKLKNGMTRINTKIKADKETEINCPGPEITKYDEGLLLNKFNDVKEGDYVFLSGSIPSSMGQGYYAEIMDRLKDRNVFIAVDTTGEALRKTLEYKPILIKPNIREMEEFFGAKINSKEEIEKYANKLKELGARNVIISMGGDGAYFTSEKGHKLFLDAPKGQVIDTVGSGDSMVAGFIYGLKNGFNPVNAFIFAVSCGSATAFSETLASKEEAFTIYDELVRRN